MQNGTVGTVIQVNVDSMMFFYANAAKVKKKKTKQNRANVKTGLYLTTLYWSAFT